jgi:hypothetical protein
MHNCNDEDRGSALLRNVHKRILDYTLLGRAASRRSRTVEYSVRFPDSPYEICGVK